MVSALQITDLTKEYPGFKLDHVSFTLPQGTIMGLIGENGAGKSTTINAILDLIKRDEGSVTFWGEELSKNPRQLKENIGVVFDGINFYETLTPVKVGKISAAAYRQWNPVVYKDYLDKFQLPSNQEIKTFSKGMKMKLCIANALSHDSKLLILDEATSGLDPVMRDDILDIFLDYIQDENHSILMSSHITTDLEKIADYVTFIHEGKIVFSKTKDELIYNYGILRCSKDDFDRIDPGDILAYRKEDYQWNVLVADRDKAMAHYRNVIVDHPTIDDILQGGTAAYQVTCCLLCSMMIMTTFSFDNISKWEKYALVMPITKKDLVTAKFLTLIIFSVFGAVTGFVLGIAGGVVFKSFHINSPEEWITLLAVAGIGMVIGIFFGSLVIPLLFKFGAEKARMLSIAAFAAPAAIGMALYKLLDMFGIPLSEKFITNLLYLSPLLVIVWVYAMYLISCHIFQKQDI